jgi:hypothetical protein
MLQVNISTASPAIISLAMEGETELDKSVSAAVRGVEKAEEWASAVMGTILLVFG